MTLLAFFATGVSASSSLPPSKRSSIFWIYNTTKWDVPISRRGGDDKVATSWEIMIVKIRGHACHHVIPSYTAKLSSWPKTYIDRPGRRCKKNVPHTQRPPVFDDECSWNQQNQTSEEGSCSWLLLSSVCSFYHQPGLRAWCWTCIDCLTDCSFIRQLE